MVNSEKKFTSVSIPMPLFEKINERIKDAGFVSVSAYVTYVLREVVLEEEKEEQALSQEDEQRIKKRLRNLGYLD